MEKTRIKKILVIGYSTRYIACSGKRAGYDILAIDHFDDIDLLLCAEFFLLKGIGPEDIPSDRELQEYIDDMKIDFDAIILGSLFERSKLDGLILNNENELMKKATDKAWVSDKLLKLGVLQPKSYSFKDISSCIDCDEDGKDIFPLIAKPKFGAGGFENLFIRKKDDILPDNSFMFQEYVYGKPVSVSLISTKDEAIAISINEQIIGKSWLGQKFPFGYCGNLTPFIPSRKEFSEKLRKISENLILELGLIGSNGVDFIVTDDEVYVIEVNPRFQSSLDTVELSTGINVFDAHVRAFEGDLGDFQKRREPKRFASKAIVYAERDFVLKKDLNKEGIADISPVGRKIPEDDPIATAIGVGKSRDEAIFSTLEKVKFIKDGARGSM